MKEIALDPATLRALAAEWHALADDLLVQHANASIGVQRAELLTEATKSRLIANALQRRAKTVVRLRRKASR